MLMWTYATNFYSIYRHISNVKNKKGILKETERTLGGQVELRTVLIIW